MEGRSFTVYTDHKPITYAFGKENQQCSPRQFRHLHFISQFTTDIRHISGEDNIVVDAHSRIDEFQSIFNYEALAASQQDDEELQSYRESNSTLQLRLIHIPDTNATVFCHVSTRAARPFITKPFRKAASSREDPPAVVTTPSPRHHTTRTRRSVRFSDQLEGGFS